jgi:REP element-mobilizing transposase RayT
MHGRVLAVQKRKPLRLGGFEYSSQRLYVVTVCARHRRCIFGDVVDESVRSSLLGTLVRRQIEALPERLDIGLDAFVVMPNHVHAIVCLKTRARQASPLRLGTVVGSFKSGSSREAKTSLWQRGYHDHVIRDDHDLERIREYIVTNPIRWARDPEHPDHHV